MKRRDLDATVSRLDAWTFDSDWAEQADRVIDEHLAILDEFGIDEDDLARLLPPSGYETLLRFALTDFWSRSTGPDGRAPIDDYFDGQGRREPAAIRNVWEAARHAQPSLYEVTSVEDGHRLHVRDALRDGEPIVVEDRDLAASIGKDGYFAARLLKDAGGPRFGPVVLVLDTASGRQIAERLRAAGPAAKGSVPIVQAILQVLWQRQEAFTAWAQSPPFQVVWPHAPADRAKIARRLDEASELEAGEFEDLTGWTLYDPQAPRVQCGHCVEWHRATVGFVEQKGDVLALRSGSLEQAKRGQELLESLLAGLLATATIQERAPISDDLLIAFLHHERASRGEGFPVPDAALLDPDRFATELDLVLATPQADLAGLTPMAAAATKKGRKKVVRWLQRTEELLTMIANAGRPRADLTRTWQQLGLSPEGARGRRP